MCPAPKRTKALKSQGLAAPAADPAAGSPFPFAPPLPHIALEEVPGVGAKTAAALRRAGFSQAADLVRHLPGAYEDRRRLTPIAQLQPGSFAVIAGRVEAFAPMRLARGRMGYRLLLADDTGRVTLHWFQGKPYSLRGREAPGLLLAAAGRVSLHQGAPTMNHPALHPLETMEEAEAHLEGITPVYPQAEGLGRGRLRRLVRAAVELVAPQAPCPVPARVLARHGLMSPGQAYSLLHQPPDDADPAELAAGTTTAHRSLAFCELFAMQASLAARRRQRNDTPGRAFTITHALSRKLIQGLPFALTRAQQRALAEIKEDLASRRPMLRLLQGDVGSGKTLVALLAALVVIENGAQAALMTPTEVLAEQHWRSISLLVRGLGVETALLTGELTGRARDDALRRLAEGRTQLVVGTHALIQRGVVFADLGLAVIDEQHRFGVWQRARLSCQPEQAAPLAAAGRASKREGAGNSASPRQAAETSTGAADPGMAHLAAAESGEQASVAAVNTLVMTATPIPRTLTHSYYGDLDVSILDELPPGRGEVETRVLPGRRRAEVYRLAEDEMKAGRQGYVVLPLVEESETRRMADAQRMAAYLREKIFPHRRIGLLHGRLPSEEKEEIMGRFAAGRLDLLVATTVIEVGVDVSNATFMIIEHADRFGLAQLHQLRGRIGRGTERSWCFLLTAQPITQAAAERLAVLERTRDGFEIAEEDLRLRGPGELLGARQAGAPDLLHADLRRDADLLRLAREEARACFPD